MHIGCRASREPGITCSHVVVVAHWQEAIPTNAPWRRIISNEASRIITKGVTARGRWHQVAPCLCSLSLCLSLLIMTGDP